MKPIELNMPVINSREGKIGVNLLTYLISFFSYSALVHIIIYSIVLFIVAIIESPLETPIVSAISGNLGSLSINSYNSNFSVIADGKDITNKISFFLVIIPIIFGVIVEILKKLIKVQLNLKFLTVATIILWIAGTVVMGIKINSFFIPGAFLLMALFSLAVYKVSGFAIKYLHNLVSRA